MVNDFSILIVDNDTDVLHSIRELVLMQFPEVKLDACEEAQQALGLINQHNPDIVLSGLSSSGMNSLELCSRIRENKSFADTYFIILTSNPDNNYRIKMLDQGANDYIIKPVTPEELIAKIKTALPFLEMKHRLDDKKKLINELADEVEKNLDEIAGLAVRYIQSRIPQPADSMKRISDASVWIASQMGETDKENLRDIEIAGLLCYSGRLFLPDNLINMPVMINGRATNNLMHQVPVSARDILSGVGRFADAGHILYHLYENFDGSGFPGKLQSWQIPLGSRIIRVILDYEEMKYISGYNSREAINMLRREEKRLYDYKVVTLFEQWIALRTEDEQIVKERIVQLQDLKTGMVISRDVMTSAGMKLLPSGAVIREGVIEKILSHNANDPILGNIIIKA